MIAAAVAAVNDNAKKKARAMRAFRLTSRYFLHTSHKKS